jgi:hypothetical protein
MAFPRFVMETEDVVRTSINNESAGEQVFMPQLLHQGNLAGGINSYLHASEVIRPKLLPYRECQQR